MRKTTIVCVAAAATLCIAVAQDVQDAAAPSPEAMARMAPGPMHAKLEPLVGSWSMHGKWRMAPDAPWQEFSADVEREWILDGRFVHETVDSEFMGAPFHGIGILGYDNTREEFTMVWVENMQTGTWFSTGHLTDDGKLVFKGEHSNGMTGEKNEWGKSVLTLEGDEHTYVAYAKDDAGETFQNMEMVATRK